MLIVKLKPNSQSFITSLSNDNRSRSKSACLALAKVISRSCPLPSTEVHDLLSYYNLQVKPHVVRLCSDINEVLLIDRETTQEYVYRLYMQRYYSAHPTVIPAYLPKDLAVAAFFDLTKSVSRDMLETIESEYSEITTMINGFTSVVTDLDTTNSSVVAVG